MTRPLAALLALTILFGCTTAPAHYAFDSAEAPPAVDRVAKEVPVVHIARRLDEQHGYGGSGVALSPTTVITCRHVVPPETGAIDINGMPVRIRALEHGSGEEAVDDWIIVQLRNASLPDVPPIHVHYDWHGEPGQRVYIAGFPGEGAADAGGPVNLTVVWGSVVHARPGPASEAGMTFLSMPGGTYHGLSGGAVTIVNEDSGEIELVGVYTGRWSRAFGPWRWDTTGLVQPIPAHQEP